MFGKSQIRHCWGILLLVLSILVVGCGYRFSVEGPGPTVGGATVSRSQGPPVRIVVQEFANKTFHPNLESIYTSFVQQQLATTGGVEVLYDQTMGDLLMKGEIVSVTIPSLTFSATETQESRVTVVVRVTVERRQTGTIVWGHTARGSGEFFVGGSPDIGGGEASLQFNQVLQDRALEQAGQRIAESIAANFSIARDKDVLKADP